ncbi:DegT/DnrJ/EryC1/StrS family aminotransferase [Streptomyces sp. N2-109]|uniref:DegT/DnrJ/EryC1/StrS family aminotransferase n=1 Tax=Streptomyces gossypii TaxID=2883101 RepID=A0ABT2JQH4_9ACTN|nr:DegT/DnrJ/EryC1/StrS family aminotransferase [Streptomyces gossypii]MCT2589615.1 DegT/DnrJ/EryC1/StrS family aminotransferase [Streptomyces gossypii]
MTPSASASAQAQTQGQAQAPEGIPFFDPGVLVEDRDAFLAGLREVGTDPEQKFILGRRTAELERKLAERTGAREVVACASGTGGLALALGALGTGPGDEVIVPAYCFAAVAAVVVNSGATPVFADVDPETMVLDPARVEELITPDTKAIIPAHLFTTMADMPRLMEIARRHGTSVVEDAAVAQGAVQGGVPAGRWGDLGVYSFFPIKAFGGPGEGGVVLTDDPASARDVRMLRNHGQDGIHRFLHHRVGHNSRYDEVQAAFQLHRLPGLAERVERRARIVDYYTERFAPLRDKGVVTPPPGRDGRCFHAYALLAPERDALRAHCAAAGVGTQVHYPVPLPLSGAFGRYAAEGDSWPGAERASAQNLAIPLWPRLSEHDIEHIADTVCAFFA